VTRRGSGEILNGAEAFLVQREAAGRGFLKPAKPEPKRMVSCPSTGQFASHGLNTDETQIEDAYGIV
jgi:hypothetical protein